MTHALSHAGPAPRGASRLAAACALSLVLAACTAATPKKTSPATGSSVPPKDPPIARSLDPDKAAGPCAGYSFDGVTIGTSRAELEGSILLTPVPREEALIGGFEGSTVGFRATRPGRLDDVQVGIGPKATVEYLRASVLVTTENTWPKSLFDALGSPKNARSAEWLWYDMKCGLSLRLLRLESLGGSDETHAYTVEIKRTLRPAE